jgi:hypothetical protein
MAKSSMLTKPKWELYGTENNPEYDYFQETITEFTDISGIKIKYWIRSTTTDEDTLYGEPSNEVEYLGPYETKILYDVTEEVTNTNTFGILSEDIVQYAFMPKYTFTRDVSASYNPRPGDVIQTLWNERSYEIVDVGEEEKIFQLKKTVWEFILKSFRFTEQSDTAKTLLKSPDSTMTTPVSAYGDNEWLEEQSDDVYEYDENSVDTSIYGY